MDLGLQGRSVLITGASRGIGLATANLLAAEGCELHLAARDGDLLRAHQERLSRDHGVKVHIHPRDLSITKEVEALGAACRNVDVLVNNAGDIPIGNLKQVDSKTWRESWDLKVFGYVDLTRIIYYAMVERRAGVIVNVIGAAGKNPNPDYIAGCMANIALNMFTQCLGGEAMRHGVRVCAVNPGPINSDRHLKHVKEIAAKTLGDESRWPELQAKFPAKRAGSVEEVANTIAFLASPRASYISGASIKIDGGLSVSKRGG
jgi:NAD(P)-dependent dehydrogenase (short-subunit alcohol dehydrogenase family)